MKRISFIPLCLFLMFISCKKNSEPTQLVDQLSDSQLQVLDAAPTDTLTRFSDVLFEDGTNISQWSLLYDSGYVSNFSRTSSILTTGDKKKLFVCRMTNTGLKLTIDSLCSCYSAQPNGLAYVYGSKHINTTYIHPSSICIEPLFGLDCSGMIYQMAKGSNLNLIESGTVAYVEPEVWNAAFNKSADFQGLAMKDLSTLPPSQFEAGDIIVASNAHMGMVYKTGSTLGIMNSQGSYKYTCKENSQPGRGPVLKSDIKSWLADLFPKNNYHVLRIGEGDVTDIDGNVYTTVKIGTQVWMRENLKAAHYRNGDPIPTGLSNTAWPATTSGAFAVYENNQANSTLYGKLYNWYAVADPRKICPAGWHVPNDAEWLLLINYLGGPMVAGGKMKETGSTYWKSPNTGASNSSGFSARPGGFRREYGIFNQLGESAYWWSSSHPYLDGAGTTSIYYTLTNCYPGTANDRNGFSCRCIKD